MSLEFLGQEMCARDLVFVILENRPNRKHISCLLYRVELVNSYIYLEFTIGTMARVNRSSINVILD